MKIKLQIAICCLFCFCVSLQAHAEPDTLAIAKDQADSTVSEDDTPETIDISKRLTSEGAGVVFYADTLFYIYTRNGTMRPVERAHVVSEEIKSLYKAAAFESDSLQVDSIKDALNIVYRGKIILSILNADAKIYNSTLHDVAYAHIAKIKDAVNKKRSIKYLLTLLKRVFFTLLVLIIIAGILWVVQFGYRRARVFLHAQRTKYFKDIVVKGYTIFSVAQELQILSMVLAFIRWVIIVLILYLALPIVFSIFPYTQGWANSMFDLVWHPTHEMLIKIKNYLPNLFSIALIIIVMRYVIRFVKYVFGEIASGKLVFTGFHPDWAMPTYSIVKFLLYAFSVVLIFPKLPGADSKSFQGVSVFLGLIVSLGSSSAISNMVAGLVITYMRPFKIGDRVMLGNISGDVLEKTLLVTRLKTIKNEEITIPNSAILSGNTINYSRFSKEEGLIVHTTVTIGYDVPWKQMHAVLVEAGLRTQFVEIAPPPFVLQTSLDDFYVAYQINVYTKEASKRAALLSSLHQNIQDVCRDSGIEIMSPHYRAERDGSTVTIPPVEEVTPPSTHPDASSSSSQKSEQL